MKILITTEVYENINGVSTSIKNLVKGLNRLGHDVKIITASKRLISYKDEKIYYIRSIKAGRLYPDLRIIYGTFFSVEKEIIDWNPDIIHSQSEFLTLEVAKRIRKKTNAKLIHTYHTMYEYYTSYVPFSKFIEKADLVKKIVRRRLKYCDAVIVPSKKIEKSLKSFGVNNIIKVIPTGVNLQTYNQDLDENKIAEIKNKYNIVDKKVIITLCRISYEKNISELIYNIKEYLLQNEDIAFLVVGDGPDKDHLKAICRDLKIEDKVIFTGMVKPEEVCLYYNLADVFISASVSETQGLTYIEALASGLPLVCRKDECLDNLIKIGENGYVYDNPKELSSLIENILLKDKSEMRKISKTISMDYDANDFGEKVSNFYQDIIDLNFVNKSFLQKLKDKLR